MPTTPVPPPADGTSSRSTGRWSVEQVEAVAPTPGVVSVARPLATAVRWHATGCDGRTVWGSYSGSGAEPYDTMVDHVEVAFRCSCPSRRTPCKHAVALLLMWARGDVASGSAPPAVAAWVARQRRGSVPANGADIPGRGGPGSVAGSAGAEPVDPPTGGDAPPTTVADATPTTEPDDPPTGGDAPPTTVADATPTTEPDGAPGAGIGTAEAGIDDDVDTDVERPDRAERDAGRDERVARMHAGLTELDRWLDDRIRTGLADPSLARYATWDELAARLVDARAGSLANRIRRLAGLVGATPDWHDRVLAELGLLHLLARAGRRLGALPGPLADAVATTVGWQVRQADVLAGVPETDEWVVAGRSDTREDRIEVRRHWLRGRRSGRWALVLSFAAYRQSLDTSLAVGSSVLADVHRYPGPALRALLGERHDAPTGPARPPAHDLAGACDEIGSMLVAEPWLDRVPTTLRGTIVHRDNRLWVTDRRGSLPLLDDDRPAAAGGPPLVLAVSEGRALDVTVEWTPHGLVPLTAHLDDRAVDVGPRADPSFVSAA